MFGRKKIDNSISDTENNLDETQADGQQAPELKVEQNEKEQQTTDTVETADGKEGEKEFVLYLIVDRSNPTALGYYRDCGVNVSKIFTDIKEAQETLLMQVNPCKIVIVDTGSGRFSTMGNRKEVLNLMGICDEDARISVYYTDTILKTEIDYIDNINTRSIHWHKYKSTPDVVAHLLKNKGKEKYIYDDYDKDEVISTDEDILHIKGLNFVEPKQIDIGESFITAHDIMIHMSENEDTTDEIESYKIAKI